jgi:hypothetical protein
MRHIPLGLYAMYLPVLMASSINSSSIGVLGAVETGLSISAWVLFGGRGLGGSRSKRRDISM